MKKALIVGINDYAPIGSGGPDLNGCINDARDMANTLVICGFSPSQIRILTNQNATRANILAYLKALVAQSVKGDSLVFYYSGHGTRVANIGTDLEIDGLDEAICPHDYASAGVICDDDFKAVLSKLKAGKSGSYFRLLSFRNGNQKNGFGFRYRYVFRSCTFYSPNVRR